MFMKLSPGRSASCKCGSHAAAASTKHIAKVTESVNIVQFTLAHLHHFERPSINGSYTRVPATAGALICRVLNKSFKTRAFLVDPVLTSNTQYG